MKVDSLKRFKLNLGQIGYFFKLVTELVKSGKDYEVNVTEWDDRRSLPASAQIQVWYQYIAELTHNDKKTVECRMKIDFGIPILLADIDKGGYPVVLNWMLNELKFYNMSCERQEKIISGISITREMKTKQHSKYREQMQSFWAQHDIHLKYKGE